MPDKCFTAELCAYVHVVVLFWNCFHQSPVLSLELLRKDGGSIWVGTDLFTFGAFLWESQASHLLQACCQKKVPVAWTSAAFLALGFWYLLYRLYVWLSSECCCLLKWE